MEEAVGRRVVPAHGQTSASDALRPRAERSPDRLTERFAGMIVDGITDGSIRPVDPSIAAELVNEMISSAAGRFVASERQRLGDGDHSDPAETWISFARPVLMGMWRPAG